MRLGANKRAWRVGLAAVSAVAVAGAAMVVPSAGAAESDAADASRMDVYRSAAEEFGVPVEVLLGVSYLESRWDVNAGVPSTAGGFGPMHLTDGDYVLSLEQGIHEHHEDARGDDARPEIVMPDLEQVLPEGELQTVDDAATLVNEDVETLRTDVEANIRGGAALLAQYQSELGAPVGADTDIDAWYAAVAKYSGSVEESAATVFADEVWSVLAEGATRTTDDGQTVALAAQPGLDPDESSVDALGLEPADSGDDLPDCPVDVSCEWMPAPYEDLGGGDYGNHDLSNRNEVQEIEYIVIHDSEGYYNTLVRLATDPNYLSWHYSMRSVDGHIANHLNNKDVGWHAGNWYVNAKAIGIEHEGFAASGAWYTEAMYRSSAKLVAHLAEKWDVPLDRQHIIGHDNIQGITPAYVRGMHWDPGPFWDWEHYFELMDAPFKQTGTERSGIVTMTPGFATNQPEFYGCENNPPAGSGPCTPRGSSSVILHTEPSEDSPLVSDIGRNPSGGPSTMYISDHGARASAGQQYAVADVDGDWTAIWYLGQKAWFHNPADDPNAVWSPGKIATPKEGRDTIPVYGRAYPEPEAYPEGVPVQPIVPLQYEVPAGQAYVVGDELRGEYYRATTFDGSSPGDWTVIRGKNRYVQVQLGHRIAYLNLDDVDVMPGNAVP